MTLLVNLVAYRDASYNLSPNTKIPKISDRLLDTKKFVRSAPPLGGDASPLEHSQGVILTAEKAVAAFSSRALADAHHFQPTAQIRIVNHGGMALLHAVAML